MRVQGLFEISIRVKHLERAASFYKEALGFQHGLLDSKRRWLFRWVNGKAGMVVLQEDKNPFPQQHFAFAVSASDLVYLKRKLEQDGIPVAGPVELSWMGARSLYFSDPDGHDLELCAL